jgi:hypothetical protein
MRALDALYAIPNDLPREQWHEVGRAAIAAGLGIDEIDSWSSGASNYKGLKDVESAFRTIKPNGGTGAGTLFHLAKQFGWQDIKNGFNQLSIKHESKPVEVIPSSSEADRLFASYLPAPADHPYIQQKKGLPDGLKVVPDDDCKIIARHAVAGWLVVPAFNADGKIQSLQYISPDKKLNLAGATMIGASFTVGKMKPDSKVFICEGIGQAWACHQATAQASVVAFGWGNVSKIAARFQNSVIVPDVGKDAEKIARDLGCQYVTLPDGLPDNYDVNDLLQEQGIDAVSVILSNPVIPERAAAKGKETSNPLDEIDAMRKAMMTTQEKIAHFAKIKHLIPELALQGHHTYLYGASGSYKTTFVTALALQAVKNDTLIQVEYWGFDVSPPYVTAVLRLIEESGLQARFSMFSGSTVSEMKTYYSIYLENNIRMDNVLVILDTYKFLSDDINNKNSNKDAMHYIKSICKLGAAWLSIGHSNKNNEHHSGTAEVEQDSDALLRIDCISRDSEKVVSQIKTGGRCRWGSPKLVIESLVLDKSAQNTDADYWYHSIKEAKPSEKMPDVDKIRAYRRFEKHFVPVLSIISRYQKENDALINKTALQKAIKDSELIDISKREINEVLNAGDGKFWKIIADRENNNRLLYEPVWHPLDDESVEQLIENSKNKNSPSELNEIS